jgi:hypothetical protein
VTELLAALVAFYIVFNRQHLVSAFNQRRRIAAKWKLVFTEAKDEERVMAGALVFLLALLFWWGSL